MNFVILFILNFDVGSGQKGCVSESWNTGSPAESSWYSTARIKMLCQIILKQRNPVELSPCSYSTTSSWVISISQYSVEFSLYSTTSTLSSSWYPEISNQPLPNQASTRTKGSRMCKRISKPGTCTQLWITTLQMKPDTQIMPPVCVSIFECWLVQYKPYIFVWWKPRRIDKGLC